MDILDSARSCCNYFYSDKNRYSVFKSCISIFVILLFLGGCTHHYVPKSTSFELDSIPEFSSKNAISLVNTQSSSEDFLYIRNAGHKFYGNLQEWTNTAIEITQRELTKRDMEIVTDAPKSLKLSVETAKGTVGAWVFRCETRLKVETSEGYVKTYLGDFRSPTLVGNLYLAADGALMRAVTEMLRDEDIISYLEK